MNCLKDYLIQKYIDGEATAEELKLIERHIAKCDICISEIESKWIFSNHIKKAIGLSPSVDIVIPKFELRETKVKKLSSLERILYLSVAASILLFLLVINQNKEVRSQPELTIESGFSTYVNANCPVTRLPLEISVTDDKGNITEFLIE